MAIAIANVHFHCGYMFYHLVLNNFPTNLSNFCHLKVIIYYKIFFMCPYFSFIIFCYVTHLFISLFLVYLEFFPAPWVTFFPIERFSIFLIYNMHIRCDDISVKYQFSCITKVYHSFLTYFLISRMIFSGALLLFKSIHCNLKIADGII